MDDLLLNHRYRILEQIGGGSQGAIYRVEDRGAAAGRSGVAVAAASRPVHRALKLLGSLDRSARDRLAGEFLRLSHLHHPALVAVHDLEAVAAPAPPGFAAGALFFTADLVEGEVADRALSGVLAAHDRDAAAALIAVAEDVASALAHIHAAGLVHADVKPSNLIISGPPDRGLRAVLVDLGLSTARDAAGEPRGTPTTMAPEALTGWFDPRSDLYSLALTILELAAGRPVRGTDAGEVAHWLALGTAPRAGDAAPWLPAELAALLDDMLAPATGDRPSSAVVVGEHLARIREALGLAGRAGALVTGEPDAVAGGRAGASGAAGAGPGAGPAGAGRRRLPPVLLPPRLSGREAALDRLERALAELSDPAASPPHLVILRGPEGVGRSALWREAVRRHQLAVAAGTRRALHTDRGDGAALCRWLAIDADAVSPVALAGRALTALATRAASAPVAFALESADPIARALIQLAPHDLAAGGGRALLVGWAAPAPAPRHGAAAEDDPVAAEAKEGVVAIEIEPLDADAMAQLAGSMLGRPVAAGWAGELCRVTAGLPSIAVEVIRAAAAQAGPEAIESVAPDQLLPRGDSALADLIRRRAAALPPELAAVLEAAAVHDGRAPIAGLAATLDRDPATTYAAAADLAARGFGQLAAAPDRAAPDPIFALPGPLHATALDSAIPPVRRRALHRAALRWLDDQPAPDPARRARHLAVTGPAEQATRAALAAAEALAARGLGAEALVWAERAAAAAPAELGGLAHAVWSERAAAVGRYRDALAAARRGARVRDPVLRRRAQLALARAQQLSGDLDAAEKTLARLRARDPADDEAAAAAARLLIARARYREAAEVAGMPEPDSAARALRVESTALARFYLGDHDGAEAALSVLEAAARTAGDRARLGRALGLRGMTAQVRGDISAAATLYERASGEARSAGDVHAAAVYDLNQATAHAERGRHGQALIALDRALAALGALGDVAELSAALYNRGISLLALGELPAAQRAAAQALARARRHGTPEMQVWASLLDGDVTRRTGDPVAAEAAYRRALSLAENAELGRLAMLARLPLAEILAEAGRPGAAAELAAARAAAASEDDRERVLLAQARVALAAGGGVGLELGPERAGNDSGVSDDKRDSRDSHDSDDSGDSGDSDDSATARQRDKRDSRDSDDSSDGSDDSSDGAGARGDPGGAGVQGAALGQSLASSAEHSRAAGRLDTAWRAGALAARLAAARGDTAHAARLAAGARAELDRIAADTPEARRAELGADPDAQALAALEADLRPRPPPAPAAAGSHLRRLLALSRRLNSELRLEPLLGDVIDTAIELTSAERGFLLLYPPGRRDRLDIVVARNIDQADLAGEEVQLSRSIAERAARAGEVQLTLDAAFDERFGAAASVAALHLRSVLAVPLRQKGRVIGTIYVDHRFRRGAFDEEAVTLACELGDIAAVAIDNARLVEDNRRRQHEIAELNRRLADDLGRREAELVAVRARLPGPRDRLRHDYPRLVGGSPAMLELLATIDRITPSSLPVVVSGESGAGKELVARALHRHGPRSERAFVAVNCGAVPEELLESELFGHVRGAFTGADRDRRGLFEVADGGTLFLDEVADTSLAMQTKLLRVLQEGELRRVGDEQTRAVDVRIIAASNRDLADLVARGVFREDLFYRLNVLPIRVPPLRERVGDIAELAGHILARLAAGGPPVPLSRAALARLCAYGWPGNVRELENELARAAALAEGTIEVGDLSAHIAAASPAPGGASSSADRPGGGGLDLEIRPQVEALERELCERALQRTGGNQTAAARLLGLSRYGLQKKLRRYGISTGPGPGD